MRAALLAFLILAACEASEQPPQAPKAAAAAKPAPGLDRSRAGKPAPDTAFQDPDGEPVTLADLRGRPVLLNLWATWCAPCVEEMPTLDALALREGSRLQVVALSEDLEGREKVEAFLAARRFRRLDSWLDREMALMAALGVQTLPTTILFDAEGREVWRVTGAEDWTDARAAALVTEASRGAAR
jgi:thiol-disulfide isomerase/thioredoxin